jgi:hypothetical protein
LRRLAGLLAEGLLNTWRGEGGRKRCLRLAELVLTALSARQGEEAAQKVLVETVKQAVASNQRAGRLAVLPKRLKRRLR